MFFEPDVCIPQQYNTISITYNSTPLAIKYPPLQQ
jgi:hypothetical protein